MDINLPLVSIVVPCYNHDKYVKECIESIFNQTYNNIELIVIDDGSVDDSVQIISEFKETNNFTFIHRPNKGLAKTINEALEYVHGEYLVIFASDDIMLPNRIEKQVQYLLENKKIAFVAANLQEINDNGDKGAIIKYPFKKGNHFLSLLNKDFYVLAPSVMMNYFYFNQYGKYDESLAFEDYDKFIQIAKNHPIGYMNDVVALYRVHDSNLHGNPVRTLEEGLKVLEKYKNEKGYLRIKNNHYTIAFRGMASFKKHKITALKLILKCFPYFGEKWINGLFNLIFKWK